MYYSAPTYYVPPPIYDRPAPTTTRPAPVVNLQFPPGFVETGRRYHKHGGDVGQIDWVKGRIGDHKVKLEFNSDGTIQDREDD
ncbi:MAG: hypothetical protein HYT48_00250 [Candidatus Vogelbacteria bacterium]|nr:hypothetical protein [Candidatus Vogelbacteria bacterium]